MNECTINVPLTLLQSAKQLLQKHLENEKENIQIEIQNSVGLQRHWFLSVLCKTFPQLISKI